MRQAEQRQPWTDNLISVATSNLRPSGTITAGIHPVGQGEHGLQVGQELLESIVFGRGFFRRFRGRFGL